MKIAMGALAVLATIGGVVQIPGVTDGLHNFLEPTFADSRVYEELEPSDHADRGRPAPRRRDLGAPASSSRYRLWVRAARAARRGCRRASRALHRFFVNKWYFDEAIDFLFVRPGRLARPLRAHHVRARASSTARSSAAPAGSCARGSAAVRGAADRLPALLRRAAADRPHRRSAPTSWSPHDRPPVDPDLLAARCSACSARSRRARRAPVHRAVGALVPLVYAVILLIDFDTARPACST